MLKLYQINFSRFQAIPRLSSDQGIRQSARYSRPRVESRAYMKK
jgi:hypothetical protein